MVTEFKIHGFPVFRRGETYYIQFTRSKKRTLKTTDKATAKKRAELVVRKYFENQIETLKKKKVQLISEYFNEYSENRGDLSLKALKMDYTAVNSLIEIIKDQPIKDIDGSHISKFIRTHIPTGLKNWH
ncbi:hypothetical protein [Desulfocicer niacini]